MATSYSLSFIPLMAAEVLFKPISEMPDGMGFKKAFN
jgi:hypothetical protein